MVELLSTIKKKEKKKKCAGISFAGNKIKLSRKFVGEIKVYLQIL